MSFSSSDLGLIEKNPLNGLDHLRDVLRQEDSTFQPSDSIGFKVPTSPRRAALTEQLLIALRYQDVVSLLHVESPLHRISRSLKNDFNYETFRPLIQLVIKSAPDVEIWAAVLQLDSALGRITPTPVTRTTDDATPITRSTSSYRGTEQTKENLDRELKYEFNGSLYRDVQGFFSKYFGERNKTRKYSKILSDMMAQHIEGKWNGFPATPSQNEFWNWLDQLQSKYFPQAPQKYYTTNSTKEIKGGEAKRQLDIFLKDSKQDILQHNWKDILLVGEHKQSYQGPAELFLQLSRYARDVFTHQPLRRFMHGFCIHGTTMELWNYDRSGAFSSGEFDIHEEPQKFAQAILGYAFMTKQELGLDTFMTKQRKKSSITIDKDVNGKKRKLNLEEEPFVRQRAIACRGTTCFRSVDHGMVIKFSWTSDKRPPESEHLLAAHQKGVEGVASLVGHQRITSISELRESLTFGTPWTFRGGAKRDSSTHSFVSKSFHLLDLSESGKRKSTDSGVSMAKRHKSSHLRKQRNATSNSLFNDEKAVYDNRLLSCLAISPAGRSLSEYASTYELLSALRDAIRAHQSLVVKAGILHRDISENNIIITEPSQANGYTGMLIDLDLAKQIGSGRSGARHQTGTMEFMAIEVLQRQAHTIRHDLESFFYVIIWICARRAWERGRTSVKRPTDDVLRGWYRGTFEEIARRKLGDMHPSGFKYILKQFHPDLHSLKPLCESIRKILFPLSERGELEVGTPPHAESLYDRVIEELETAIRHDG